MDDTKRTRVGFLGSLGIHAVIFLLVAASGIFAIISQTADSDDIVDVSVYDSGGGPGTGGGGGGGGGNGGTEAVITQSGMTSTPAAAKSTDTITENNKAESQTTAAQSAAEATPAAGEQDQQNAESSGSGAGSGSGDSAGTGGGSGGGNGTGQGTGEGSGQGPGSGSGSGGGNGSGHGTGNGSGNGPGSGGGTSNVDLSDRPHVVGSSLPVIPQSALKRGPHSARMVVAIVVGTGGGVDSVSVVSSTGYADLDTAGINAAYSYSFTPARDRYGQPRRARVQIPISFRVR
jgi:protein TonB